MSEMVERVARSIFMSKEYGRASDVWDDIDRRVCLDYARAAIAAMSEPSHWMEDCGIALLDEATGDNNVKRAHLVRAYEAMIDAALVEDGE